MSEDTAKKNSEENVSKTDELRDEELDNASGAGGTYFVADSFQFAVEREMKESGEKGGTEDLNIGVGELQECTVSKSTDGEIDNIKR